MGCDKLSFPIQLHFALHWLQGTKESVHVSASLLREAMGPWAVTGLGSTAGTSLQSHFDGRRVRVMQSLQSHFDGR